MNALRLALRMLLRDLRAGELSVLAAALMLAVAALTCVGFLADRAERAIVREAHQLLGGDLLLTADHPWPDRFRTAAHDQGLHLAESAGFASMVAGANNSVHLAEIKAVSPDYPLRGSLRITSALHAPDGVTGQIPERGTVWPDERLTLALGLASGETLRLGTATLAVGAILTQEPERGIHPFALAPRLLISLSDLPKTGLIQPGSRVQWRLHLAGPATGVAAFRTWAEANLGRGERIEGLSDARPEVRNAIERIQRFLRLAALLTTILAAVAVGLAARRYMDRHLDACAVMRCFGASERQLLCMYGGEFILLGLAASLLGGGGGYLIQLLLQQMLAGLVSQDLPPPGWQPWLHGFSVSLVLIVGFVLPPLLRLKRVSTVRVLRREWDAQETLPALSYLVGLLSLAALMLWMSDDISLGAIVLLCFSLAVGLYFLAAHVGIRLLGRLRFRKGWRLGIANLGRHPRAIRIQAVALALGMTALLLLTVAKDGMLAAWQAKLPPDAPNRFLINIQPEQKNAIAAFFLDNGLEPPRLEPMVRGRLVSLNGRRVGPQDYVEERARHLVEREFNLSSRNDLPSGNRIVAGSWHGVTQGVQFSVEKGLAETLNLHVGDRLAFDIAGQTVEAHISSLRKLDWDSMQVNFFVLAPAGSLDLYPTSYITSFHLPNGREGLIDTLVRQHPNLTVIDVVALVRQMQAMLDQAAGAVRLVFGFALLAGLAVLYAALQAGAQERHHELAVLRTLGGRRGQLRQALFAEFAALGAIAGLLAGSGAAVIGSILARWVLRLDYVPSMLLPLTGLWIGLLGIGLAGLFATRSTLHEPIIEGLRSP